MYPFERFTKTSKQVLTLAQDEAQKAHHSYIGTEHLLLGLLRGDDTRTTETFSLLGVEIEQVRATIESVLGGNERIIVQQIIPTSRVKKVIELAFEEAKRGGDAGVAPEHILVGLLVEGEGIAAHVLVDLGANLEKVRQVLGELPPRPDGDLAGPGSDSPGITRIRSFQESRRALTSSGWTGFVPASLRPAGTTVPESFNGTHASASAKSALALCEEEALRSGIGVIETDHLVLGLLRQSEGSAARALQQLGVSLGVARQASFELRPGRDPVLAPELLEGDDYRIALKRAAEGARSQGRWLDTEHLLQSAIAARHGAAARVLQRLGVGEDQVTEALSALWQDRGTD
jgi:ATP-dependent Clp protease ATP-binding subunit ClpA